MTTNPDLEDLREARDIIRELYSTAHSLACDKPDCPWAQLFNEHSESTNVDASPREDALLCVFFAIVEKIDECIDLIRILVANRDEASRLGHLSQSSATSRSSTEDTAGESPDSLDEAPIPGLYRDQWTQTPVFSPPAYTAFIRRRDQGYPLAPAPSPAASETTTLSARTPVTEHEEEAGHGGQGEQARAGTSTEPSLYRARDP